jgi:hypothetical protein
VARARGAAGAQELGGAREQRREGRRREEGKEERKKRKRGKKGKKRNRRERERKEKRKGRESVGAGRGGDRGRSATRGGAHCARRKESRRR